MSHAEIDAIREDLEIPAEFKVDRSPGARLLVNDWLDSSECRELAHPEKSESLFDVKQSSSTHSLPQKIWLRDMIGILSSRLLGLHIEQLEQALWEQRYPATPMPKRFRSIVQIILSQHSSQSVVFRQKKRKPSDDLFFSPEGKGSGTWTVHHARAEAWLKKHQIFAPHR